MSSLTRQLEEVVRSHTHPSILTSQREEPTAPAAEVATSAADAQVGGGHYKSMKFQPISYILANDIGFVEGAVIKYVSRWRAKGGIEDLKKARHMLDLYIEHLSSNA